MADFLFVFGYESPDDWRANQNFGTDAESSYPADVVGNFTPASEGRMTFKVQVYHADSGFFLNTNHESQDLDELKRLISSETFDGVRCRIVDGAGNEVQAEHPPRERKSDLTIDDIARILKVPVVKRFEDLDLPGWTHPDDLTS
jgi:hypothetical protein